MEINISLSTEFGWKQYSVADYTVWFKGYLINENIADLFQHGHDLLHKKNTSKKCMRYGEIQRSDAF